MSVQELIGRLLKTARCLFKGQAARHRQMYRNNAPRDGKCLSLARTSSWDVEMYLRLVKGESIKTSTRHLSSNVSRTENCPEPRPLCSSFPAFSFSKEASQRYKEPVTLNQFKIKNICCRFMQFSWLTEDEPGHRILVYGTHSWCLWKYNNSQLEPKCSSLELHRHLVGCLYTVWFRALFSYFITNPPM